MSFSENIIKNPKAIARTMGELKNFLKEYNGGEPNTIVEKDGSTILYDGNSNPFVRTDVAKDERSFKGVDENGNYYDFSALYIDGMSEIFYAGHIYNKEDNSLRAVIGDKEFDPVEAKFDSIRESIEVAQAEKDGEVPVDDGKAMGDD